MILTLILFLASPFQSSFAHAADLTVFAQYPAKTEVNDCHKLDFDSYFRAQQFKSSILRLKPEVAHPNFGGNFLIFKAEMLLETIWFIADCKTGKFFHDTLSGDLVFNPNSNAAILNHPKGETDYQLWSGTEWVKMEAPAGAAATTAMTTTNPTGGNLMPAVPANSKTTSVTTVVLSPPGILQHYDEQYARYSAPTPDVTCHALDYDSYFRAQTNKSNLKQLNNDVAHPNFGGKYLLLRTDAIFEKLWLIANCETGKFYPYYLTGNANFKNTSTLVVINSSSDFPKLMVWRDQEWVQIVDPVQNKKQKISNRFGNPEALMFFQALPNPDKNSSLSFTLVDCVFKKGSLTADHCSVNREENKKTDLSAEQIAKIAPLVQKWGNAKEEAGIITYRIQSGKCVSDGPKPACEVVTEPFSTP